MCTSRPADSHNQQVVRPVQTSNHLRVKMNRDLHYVLLPTANANRSLRPYKTRMPERDSNVRRVVPSRAAMKIDVDCVPLVRCRKQKKQREKHRRNFIAFDVDYTGLHGPAMSSLADEDVGAS